MGATRPASGIKVKAYTPNKGSQTALITRLSVNFFLKNPDAGRVAPISACVWCLNPFVWLRFTGRKLCFLCSLCSYVPAVSVMAKSYCDLPLTREHKNKSPCPYVLKFFCSSVLLSLCSPR